MSAYPKTENLYARDEETHKLVPGVFKRADFAQIGSWLVTEKVDGTNIRLIYDRDSGEVSVRGRTDAASLPGDFVDEAFPQGLDPRAFESALKAIDPSDRAGRMVVYGKGYGPGIQKDGAGYAARKSFVAFDVVTYLADDVLEVDGDGQERPRRVAHSPLWRTWADVETVCAVAGLETVPVLGKNCKTETVFYIATESDAARISYLAARKGNGRLREPEGVVARTDPYLFDFRGDRVLFKLKPKDLP